jgi:hypothetical protein
LASPGGQLDGEPVADGEGLPTGTVGRADGEGLVRDTVGRTAGSGVAGEAEGTAVARVRGEAAGIAADVPAGKLGAMSAAVPGLPSVPLPDTSSAVTTAVTMSTKAAAQATRAVWKPASSSRELMASRSLARPAARA